jgi:hypothetical protein
MHRLQKIKIAGIKEICAASVAILFIIYRNFTVASFTTILKNGILKKLERVKMERFAKSASHYVGSYANPIIQNKKYGENKITFSKIN